MSHTCFYFQLQTITALQQVLISHPTEDERLSWPRWLITCTHQVTTPGTMVTHFSTDQAELAGV